MDAQSQLRLMLEGTNQKDLGFKSPLEEVSPESIDELMTRIDNFLTLGGVPPREDRDKIILHYRSLRGRFLDELKLMQQEGRKRVKLSNIRDGANSGSSASRQLPKPLPKISTEDLFKDL